MLYIVSTPIGNLQDITFRAVDILRKCDFIAAEDTRHAKILLNHYHIKTPLTSYHEHSSKSKTDYLLTLLMEGKNIALISDAGTPGISDPGYLLVKQAKDKGILMTAVPGPTALIAALSLSGASAHRFLFEGFLPVKPGARRKRLEGLKNRGCTVILYESPHRLEKTLKDIQDILGDPKVFCVREITKKYEEVQHAKASELLDVYSAKNPKGEFVVIIDF